MAKRKKPDTEETTQQAGDVGEGSTGATTGDEAEPTEEPAQEAQGDDSEAEGERAPQEVKTSAEATRVSSEPEREPLKANAPRSDGGFFAGVARWLWTDLEGK